MLDRTTAPEIHEVDQIKFLPPQIVELNNNVSLFWLRDVPNSTARIDFYFDAGTIRSKSLVASLTAGMIFSGTNEKDSITFHNLLDDLGAFYDVGVSHENAVISFYGLNDQMCNIFKIFEEAIEKVIFPQTEFEEIIQERKQKLQVSLEKVGVLAQREFQKSLFYQTAYGRYANLEDYNNISRSEIIDFFERYYKSGLTKIVVVGDISDLDINYIKNQSKKWCVLQNPKYDFAFSNKPTQKHLIKEGAIQAAIRIGKILFNKQHEDYIPFTILNTILGDYFGSRLMKNIREDKGYTYGVGSYVSEFNETGYLIIATEVGKEFLDQTILEIRKEIELLSTNLISHEELDLVRSYLLGQLLKSADGPYATMDLFLGAEQHGLNLEFYNQYIHKVRTIEPEELRKIARKHLSWESFSIISVG